jgi:hypothetical protein
MHFVFKISFTTSKNIVIVFGVMYTHTSTPEDSAAPKSYVLGIMLRRQFTYNDDNARNKIYPFNFQTLHSQFFKMPCLTRGFQKFNWARGGKRQPDVPC